MSDTSPESLIAQLDPTRDYGERTFDDIVSGIRSGSIIVHAGERLPVIKDASSGKTLKGTGAIALGGQSIQQKSLAEFRRRAYEDMDEAYVWLVDGMRKGDPRFHKIFWETLVGKAGENRGGEQIAEAFKAVVQAMQQPQERKVTFDA